VEGVGRRGSGDSGGRGRAEGGGGKGGERGGRWREWRWRWREGEREGEVMERWREREVGYVIRGLSIMGVPFGTVMHAVKDRIKLLGLGFELCKKGAGTVCGNTTDGYGPGPAKSWRTRLSKSCSVVRSMWEGEEG
jgi:hypothetical protein